MPSSRTVILLLLALLLAGCGGGSAAPIPLLEEAEDEDEDVEEPEILGLGHHGWGRKWCGDCHTLPVEDHDTVHLPTCAHCHGGNGACDPNGTGVDRIHVRQDACVHCHGMRHGYETDPDCRACHFAAAGLADCGAVRD